LEKIKIKTKDLNFSLFQWIIVVIRSLILLSVIGFNVLFQSFITFTVNDHLSIVITFSLSNMETVHQLSNKFNHEQNRLTWSRISHFRVIKFQVLLQNVHFIQNKQINKINTEIGIHRNGNS
jgi:hypothetical protein